MNTSESELKLQCIKRFILEHVEHTEHIITAEMESMARPRESLAAFNKRS
jgi:hypothetical protein